MLMAFTSFIVVFRKLHMKNIDREFINVYEKGTWMVGVEGLELQGFHLHNAWLQNWWLHMDGFDV